MHTLIFLLFSLEAFAKSTELRIDAAASLSNVLPEIAREYAASEKQAPKTVFNFDATSKLAKQVESGAPADLFFSADSEWMDELEQKDKLLKGSRVDLLSNKIVLIVPADSKNIPSAASDLAQDSYKRIALAGEAVPVGKFARAALKSDGNWTEAIQKKVVNADNVRVALTWVAVHEAEAGVVYATDASIEPKVKVAFAFAASSYPKIVYPGAVLRGTKLQAQAEKFLTFCKSKKAKQVFEKAGFIVL